MKSQTKTNIVIAFIAFSVGVIATIALLREPMEPLTDHALEVAHQHWRLAGIRNYDLHFKMNGSEYKVTVRQGLVYKLLVNGKASTAADKQAYSVNGLLELMQLELENLNDPAGPFAAFKEIMIARVRFNSRLGYVERYLRSGMGQAKGAFIELIRFQRIDNGPNTGET